MIQCTRQAIYIFLLCFSRWDLKTEIVGGRSPIQKIWAKNNGDGKGATFSFSLPLSGNHIDSPPKEEDK